MSRGHVHSIHGHDTQGLRLAFWLNLLFAIAEFIGGLFTNSMAILSDAFHDLGDAAVILMSWRFEKYSQRDPDSKFTYGYTRFSLLGALMTGLVLAIGSGLIIRESIPRLFDTPKVKADFMVIIAVVGVIINSFAMLRLRKDADGMNRRMIMLHMLEDVLGWVAVLIGAIFIWAFEIPIIDPILSIGINLFILYRVFKNLKETIDILMQRSPKVDQATLAQKITALPNVVTLHALQLWSLDGTQHILSTHLVIKKSLKDSERSQLKRKIKALLEDFNVHNATIEFETEEEPCEVK